MTNPDSIAWLCRRIERATSLPALQQIKDDIGGTFAVLSEIKTALLVREKELRK